MNFEDFNKSKYPRVKCTVDAIIIKEGRVLLTKRALSLQEGGKWCLPGGHIDIGESAEDAVKREVKEETGFEVTSLKFLFYYDEFLPELKNHSVTLVFRIDILGSSNKNNEVSDFGWFSRREIAKLDLAFAHMEILEKFWRTNES